MKYIALHHTTIGGNNWQIWGVNRYHKDKWGMQSTLGWYVGYNYFCEKDGKRTNTRKIGEETIANQGHNCDIEERCDTISYCMAGDFDTERPTNEQEQDFVNFINEIRNNYPDIKILGHRDIQKNRTCPGSQIKNEDFERWNKLFINEDEEKKDIANQIKRIDQLLSIIARLINQLINKNGKK